MRRKVLQDYANTLCQMLVGWRMGDDLEVLSELPDGVLTINVLEGTVAHSVAGPLGLHIALELQAWFLQRLEISNISRALIRVASVQAQINTGRIATNRKKIISFDFEVNSSIETDESVYSGQLKEVHRWHQRLPSNNSIRDFPSTRPD